jgi:hypothetical protein
MGMLQLGSRARLSLLASLAAPGALGLACSGESVNNYYSTNYYAAGGAEAEPEAGKGGRVHSPDNIGGEGGTPAPQMGGAGAGGDSGGAGGDSGGDPRYRDAPLADTLIAELPLDIFGTIGNRYWFAVADEQRAAMNQRHNGGEGPWGGGLYTPGGTGLANWVDHLFVTTAGEHPKTADFGQVQVKVVGQSTFRPWDPANIPNLNIDADQFVQDQRIAGYEHLRFGNGQFGSIFRDKLAYDLYRELDYPAPLAAYAWVSSNVWGPEISIPYTLIERYKRTFCDRYSDEFGGGCPNMWEFYGDFNGYFGGGGPNGGPNGGPIIDAQQLSLFDDPANCQMGKCDSTRVKELEAVLLETPMADGFKAALASYIDWPAFHKFQCISWVFSTSDDPIHANNNVVLVERADGLFQYLPYSVDFSFGSSGTVDLRGQNVLARGCQADSACWADTLDVCEGVIADFKALEPLDYVQSLYDDLDANGMLRPGDDANFQGVSSYITKRLAYLPDALERYRTGATCEEGYEECDGQCVPQGQCSCVLPDPPPGGMGGGGQAGPGMPIPGPGGGPIICPVDKNYAVAPAH